MAKLIAATALFIGAGSLAAGLFVGSSTAAMAQNQPYYGANAPGGYDTYGEPYSGSAASRRQAHGW